MLAQFTGTHLQPGCLPATPLELDALAYILSPYIYITQKKLYGQQLAFIRASLALTGTGGGSAGGEG